MPIDNDYFKNRQQQNKGSNNGSNNNWWWRKWRWISNHLFKHLRFFKNFNKQSGIIYAIIAIAVVLFMTKPYVIINSGEVGIKVTTGKYEHRAITTRFSSFYSSDTKSITVDTKVRLN